MQNGSGRLQNMLPPIYSHGHYLLLYNKITQICLRTHSNKERRCLFKCPANDINRLSHSRWYTPLTEDTGIDALVAALHLSSAWYCQPPLLGVPCSVYLLLPISLEGLCTSQSSG